MERLSNKEKCLVNRNAKRGFEENRKRIANRDEMKWR